MRKHIHKDLCNDAMYLYVCHIVVLVNAATIDIYQTPVCIMCY